MEVFPAAPASESRRNGRRHGRHRGYPPPQAGQQSQTASKLQGIAPKRLFLRSDILRSFRRKRCAHPVISRWRPALKGAAPAVHRNHQYNAGTRQQGVPAVCDQPHVSFKAKIRHRPGIGENGRPECPVGQRHVGRNNGSRTRDAPGHAMAPPRCKSIGTVTAPFEGKVQNEDIQKSPCRRLFSRDMSSYLFMFCSLCQYNQKQITTTGSAPERQMPRM